MKLHAPRNAADRCYEFDLDAEFEAAEAGAVFETAAEDVEVGAGEAFVAFGEAAAAGAEPAAAVEDAEAGAAVFESAAGTGLG